MSTEQTPLLATPPPPRLQTQCLRSGDLSRSPGDLSRSGNSVRYSPSDGRARRWRVPSPPLTLPPAAPKPRVRSLDLVLKCPVQDSEDVVTWWVAVCHVSCQYVCFRSVSPITPLVLPYYTNHLGGRTSPTRLSNTDNIPHIPPLRGVFLLTLAASTTQTPPSDSPPLLPRSTLQLRHCLAVLPANPLPRGSPTYRAVVICKLCTAAPDISVSVRRFGGLVARVDHVDPSRM
jgi:hypothetical protein